MSIPRLIGANTEPPEKLYGWRNTQLSVARHYGGLKVYGREYLIDMADPDQPLVRSDVFKRERKAAKQTPKPKESDASTQQTIEGIE